jgi:hypothetical protein
MNFTEVERWGEIKIRKTLPVSFREGSVEEPFVDVRFAENGFGLKRHG